MRSRPFRPARRKTQRRWRVPPALTRGDEPIEGLALLDEVSGPLGMILWQSLRDVTLWSSTGRSRNGLFDPEAERNRVATILTSGVPEELERPLHVLAALAGDPAGVTPEAVSLACRELSQWLDERGHLASALAFAQGAALAAPGSAAIAFSVGRFARRRAENVRAETWFRRSVALARQAGDWVTYARSFLGLGALHRQRGAYPAAERFFERAVRAASRNALRDVEALALHDLFTLAVSTERPAEAERYARLAFEAYGPDHAQLALLANDIAYFWLTRGHFHRTLPVFRSVLTRIEAPEAHVLVLGSIARAAGGAGETAEFQEAWDRVWDAVYSGDAADHSAPVLLDLAHGAASLRLWERAEQAAERALAIATERSEAKRRFDAESVLDAVRHHRRLDAPTGPQPDVAPAQAERLADELVTSLRAQAGVA